MTDEDLGVIKAAEDWERCYSAAMTGPVEDRNPLLATNLRLRLQAAVIQRRRAMEPKPVERFRPNNGHVLDEHGEPMDLAWCVSLLMNEHDRRCVALPSTRS